MQSDSGRPTRRFLIFCVAVALGVVAYIAYSRPVRPGSEPTAVPPMDPSRLAEARRASHVFFRITALGPSYGRLGVVRLAAPDAPPLVTDLSCDRVHESPQFGLCLQADRGVLTTYRAVVFDAQVTPQFSFPLQGAPSRARVAAAAPLGTSTVFVSGDSYAAGAFSTRTTLYDLENHAVLGELESFAVEKDGQPFKRQDFNFWGVTFRDGDRFYATLGTGGNFLLVEGSMRHRKMAVIVTGVECPMLSPDATRLIYKNRVLSGGRLLWRLRVLDLQTRGTTDLPELRSVDDQPEWLDDRHVLYALPREGTGSSDVWVAPVDGSGSPKPFLRDAFSPAVVRIAPE